MTALVGRPSDMIPFMFDEIVVEGDTESREYAYAHVCPQCANLYNLPTSDTCLPGNICLVKHCHNETSLVHYIWDYRRQTMTHTVDLQIIAERFYNEHQSWIYEKVVKRGPLKLRVLIRRNSYDDQSSLRGYAFDAIHNQWNLLVDRPMNERAKCYEVSYVQPREKANLKSFQDDAMAILGELLQIIAD
jgi:hypothetical protein